MNGSMSPAMEYQVDGICMDAKKEHLRIDLSEPRTIFVKGENPKTGKEKFYLLRVTHAGGLVLQ